MANVDKLHIAMFPWLAYGHIMPFFELSNHLAQKGHKVSFISTPNNIHRLPKPPPSLSPLISFVEVPLPHIDGLPQAAESTSELPSHQVPYLKKAYDMLQLPLTQLLHDSDITWIIHDFAPHWLPRVVTQLGLSSVFFSTFNATVLAFLGPPSEMINGSRQRPEDYMVPPKWIDFPCNVAYKLHELLNHQVCMDMNVPDLTRFAKVIEGCKFVTLRSCNEFEPESLTLLQKLYGKPVVPVGLLPPAVQYDEEDQRWESLNQWLSKKRENSVVYIALGTEVTLSQELMHELAHGIEKSGLPFIWVVKNAGPDVIPSGFETSVSDRGFVWTGWAPQLRILGHPSVGGFLTHCGWSSVIEALGFGRVLILFSGGSSDQGLTARLLHGKRVGLEIPRDNQDGLFTSGSVAESIRRVMVDHEGEALRANAWAMKEIFGNVDLNKKYLDEFTRLLETESASTRSH